MVLYGASRTKHILTSLGNRNDSELVCQKVQEELRKGKLLGPFGRPITDISPVMAIEKKTEGKFRPIHNLSAQRGSFINKTIPVEYKM